MGNSLVHLNGKVFEVVGPIGDGGFAHVYQLRRDGQRFALKWTRGVTEGEDLERLLLEIQVMRRLQHQNVLTLLESEVRKCQAAKTVETTMSRAGRDRGQLKEKEVLMLFPLATGGSLQSRLDQAAARREPAFSESECLQFFSKLVDAVAALHGLGFAHRDLKPGNILLNSSDPVEPLLMDFGSVSALEIKIRGLADGRRIWEEAARFTSAPYRAPELWETGSDVNRLDIIDGRADVWSLGCILYAMAFGPLSPFEHPRDGVQHLAIVNGYVSFPAGNMQAGQAFSATFAALIKWILTPDVAERPTLKGMEQCVCQLLNPGPRRQPSYTAAAVRRSSSRRRQSNARKQSLKQEPVPNTEDWADFSSFEQPQSMRLASSTSMALGSRFSSKNSVVSSTHKLSTRHASLTALGVDSTPPSIATKDRSRGVSDAGRHHALSRTGRELWKRALEAQYAV